MARARLVAAGAAVGVALLTLLWASGDGTPLLRAPSPLPLPAPDLGLPAAPPTDPAETVEPGLAQRPDAGSGVPVELVLVSLAVVGLLSALLRFLLSRDWEPEDTDPLPDEDALDRVLRATSPAARRAALAEGDPRNAVVACWVALEDAAERAGLPRHPAETSAELARRVLATWDVPAPVVEELAGLYREARFSTHPLSEQQQQQAVAALEVIHEQLGRQRRTAAP